MFGEKKFTGVGFPTPVSIPDETTCLLVQVPADPAWWALFVGVLYQQTLVWNWRQFEGGIEPSEAAAKWQEILDQALDIASVSSDCDYDVPAPYWDDSDASDADDEGTVVEQPWYGEIINEGVTWREQVGIWAITAFLAVAATPAAAIAFLPFANKFVLAFKQHSLGAIVKVLIDGVEMATVDTYAPTDGVTNVTISLPAPAGFRAFDVDAPVLWVMNTGTANPAVEGTPTMAVIRKRLDQTEVTPSNLRWNVDCDCVQQTPDNGSTWIDSPTQDPRSSTIFQVPLRTTGDVRCDSAQQMHDQIKSMLDAIIASSSILQAINAVVGIVSLFFFEIGIVIEALWAIVTAVFGVGTTVLDAALDTTAYDQLLCILYCEIGADGSVDLDQFDTIAGRVNAEINTVAAFAITSAMQTIGFVGMTNAGALGEVTGDCAGCDCGWCQAWDFLPSDGGYAAFFYASVWTLGEGWRQGDDPSHATEGSAITLNFTAGNITHAEFTYDATLGTTPGNATVFLFLSGVQVQREDVAAANGTNTWQWDGDPTMADQVVFAVQVSGAGALNGLGSIIHAQLEGIDTSPFGADNC